LIDMGRWTHERKRTVESSARLDAARLFGKGKRLAPEFVKVGGSWGGTVTGSWGRVAVQLYNGALFLLYTVDGVKADQVVKLELKPCNYGGDRVYFRCPVCNGRARVLLLPPRSAGFACRKCHNLTYTERQQYTPPGFAYVDLLLKTRRLEARLEACQRSRKKKPRLMQQYHAALKALRAELEGGQK
jgi:hypothetical protein